MGFTPHQAAVTGSDMPFGLVAPFVVCPKCGMGAGTGDKVIEDYFYNKSLVCSNCHTLTSAWHAYLATIHHPVPFLRDFAAAFVGFKTAIFKVKIAPRQRVEVDFCKLGVPSGARLIRVNYTPEGTTLFPVELHGNDALVKNARDVVWLYGVPSGVLPVDQLDPINVTVYVTFFDSTNPALQTVDGLSKAFVALNQNELVDMVIPAVMAVEFRCKSLLHKSHPIADQFVNISDKDLLTKPIKNLALSVGFPELNAEVVDKIKRLWGQRDKVAHEGRLHLPYDQQAASVHLAAAVFTVRYLDQLEKAVMAFKEKI